MRTIDLKETNSSIRISELGNFLHQKFLYESLIFCHLKPIDIKINYKRIFKNGLSEETIENTFALARFKLKFDLEKIVEMHKHSHPFQYPKTYNECYNHKIL